MHLAPFSVLSQIERAGVGSSPDTTMAVRTGYHRRGALALVLAMTITRAHTSPSMGVYRIWIARCPGTTRHEVAAGESQLAVPGVTEPRAERRADAPAAGAILPRIPGERQVADMASGAKI